MKREKGEGLCENRDYAYSQKMYAVEEDRVLCKLRLGEGKSIWRNEWDAILLLKMYTLTNTQSMFNNALSFLSSQRALSRQNSNVFYQFVR